MKRTTGYAAQEDGAIAVTVAILLFFAFLGLAALTTDIGMVAQERRQLQTAADAGAMAAVRRLPGDIDGADTNAEILARDNAAHFVSVATTYSAFGAHGPLKVQVTVNGMAPLGFARIWGRTQQPARATAAATVGSPTAYGRGVMPFGIMARGSTAPPYGLADGEDTVLHTDPQDNSQGNYHTVELDKTTPYSDANNIQGVVSGGGTTSIMSIGDVLRTEPGNAANPEYNALEHYFTCSHTHADLDASFDSEIGVYTLRDSDGGLCRRMITCPVIAVGDSLASPGYDWDSLNGRSGPVVVVGFANYFVESVPERGTLVGQFVQVIDPDSLGSGQIIDWAGLTYALTQ